MRVDVQMKAFMKGFNSLVPQNHLQIFDENEVEVSEFWWKYFVNELQAIFVKKLHGFVQQKNKLQVILSHKFSKSELFKLSDRQIMPIYMVQLKIILPKLIYIYRGMIEE